MIQASICPAWFMWPRDATSVSHHIAPKTSAPAMTAPDLASPRRNATPTACSGRQAASAPPCTHSSTIAIATTASADSASVSVDDSGTCSSAQKSPAARALPSNNQVAMAASRRIIARLPAPAS